MTNDKNSNFDSEERTARFGEEAIKFCKPIALTDIVRPIVVQFIRSSTSVGANYMEANGASSKKDFLNKICICKKEARETKHWLRMLATALPEKKEKISLLWKEAQELTLIFSKITISTRS